jgi:hypothetical protein
MFHSFAHNHSHAHDILTAHPLVIAALKEDVWNRNPESAASPFRAWPPRMIERIYDDFNVQIDLPRRVRWDHIIYAYLLEKTGMVRIFKAVKESLEACEDLTPPSVETQQFWRNTNAMFYSRPYPESIDYTVSDGHPDETGNRMSHYWRMFGMELGDDSDPGPDSKFKKDPAANEGFKFIFEALASEAWIGIVNTRNISGPNNADDAAIGTAAAQLRDMLLTRRQNFNLLREEYRAVLLTSWLYLAISYDSPVVRDLKAQAHSPDMRLAKIANRVGMKTHPSTRPLLDLAHPMSFLLRAIEFDHFTTAHSARQLYEHPRWRAIAEAVIENYSLAMGQNLKAQPVYLTSGPSRTAQPPAPVAIPRPRPVAQIEAQRPVVAIAGTR